MRFRLSMKKFLSEFDTGVYSFRQSSNSLYRWKEEIIHHEISTTTAVHLLFNEEREKQQERWKSDCHLIFLEGFLINLTLGDMYRTKKRCHFPLPMVSIHFTICSLSQPKIPEFIPRQMTHFLWELTDFGRQKTAAPVGSLDVLRLPDGAVLFCFFL